MGHFKRGLGKFQIAPNHPCLAQNGTLGWQAELQSWSGVAGVVSWPCGSGHYPHGASPPVTPMMELKPNAGSDRAWVWNTHADFADERPKPELLAIRFLNAESKQEGGRASGWPGCCRQFYSVAVSLQTIAFQGELMVIGKLWWELLLSCYLVGPQGRDLSAVKPSALASRSRSRECLSLLTAKEAAPASSLHHHLVTWVPAGAVLTSTGSG